MGVVVLEEEDAVLAVAVAAGDASYRPARPPAGISSLTCPKDPSSKPKACRMLVNSWLVVALCGTYLVILLVVQGSINGGWVWKRSAT